MADKDITTTNGRETTTTQLPATVRTKSPQPARRSAARSRGAASMLCIPARDGGDSAAHGSIAKVVITRDPKKPIYVCWEEKDGANLSVAIEAEGKE